METAGRRWERLMLRPGVHKRWGRALLHHQLDLQVPETAKLDEERLDALAALAEKHRSNITRCAEGHPEEDLPSASLNLAHWGRATLRKALANRYRGLADTPNCCKRPAIPS